MPPDPRVIVGAAAVTAHEGKLLMIERAGKPGTLSGEGAGTWGLPGGWVDYEDADVESTAVRETREETSVWVDPWAAGGHVFTRSTDRERAIVTLFVICRYVHGEPQVMEPDKCPQVEWVPLDEVHLRPLFAPLALWWPTNGRYLMVDA